MAGFLDRVLAPLNARLARIEDRLAAIEASLGRIEQQLPNAENLMRAITKSRWPRRESSPADGKPPRT